MLWKGIPLDVAGPATERDSNIIHAPARTPGLRPKEQKVWSICRSKYFPINLFTVGNRKCVALFSYRIPQGTGIGICEWASAIWAHIYVLPASNSLCNEGLSNWLVSSKNSARYGNQIQCTDNTHALIFWQLLLSCWWSKITWILQLLSTLMSLLLMGVMVRYSKIG